jgi:hypothetical protein
MAEKSRPPALRVVGDSANLAGVWLPTVITSIASFENYLYSQNEAPFRTQRMHLHF